VNKEKNYPAQAGNNVLYITVLLTLPFVNWGAEFPDNLDLVAGSALLDTLGNLPLSSTTSFLAIFLIATFFITSADSGTFVVAMLTSGGSQKPTRKL
jgi:choline-glycine betaine transporter